jgi:hypothetical protein
MRPIVQRYIFLPSLRLFLENHRAFLEKGAPKTFLLGLAGQKFPAGTTHLSGMPPLLSSELEQGHPK